MTRYNISNALSGVNLGAYEADAPVCEGVEARKSGKDPELAYL